MGVELRIVDEVVGLEVCAATTHPCVSSRLQPGLSRQCLSRRHREPRLPFTGRRCSLNLLKSPALSSSDRDSLKEQCHSQCIQSKTLFSSCHPDCICYSNLFASK